MVKGVKKICRNGTGCRIIGNYASTGISSDK